MADLTPEQAADKAAAILDEARETHLITDAAASLVGIADGWTRLYTALASRTSPPAETVVLPPGAALPAEVHALVHAAYHMCNDWAEADEMGRRGLWKRLHAANEAVWTPTTPPVEPAPLVLPPGDTVVQMYGDHYQIIGWDFKRDDSGGPSFVTLRVIPEGTRA